MSIDVVICDKVSITCKVIPCSVVVSIPTCRAGDLSSLSRWGDLLGSLPNLARARLGRSSVVIFAVDLVVLHQDQRSEYWPVNQVQRWKPSSMGGWWILSVDPDNYIILRLHLLKAWSFNKSYQEYRYLDLINDNQIVVTSETHFCYTLIGYILLVD